jgi:cyclopropane-fatty-acyl-phospholipid synthase
VVKEVVLALAERGLLPDGLVGAGIRRLLRHRLAEDVPAEREARARAADRVREAMARAPVAEASERANAQHYEVPARFFELCLGPRLKYSSCLWPDGCQTLAEAEEAMLRLTCERAGIEDGQQILELGCGWGSLTLWMAERYPTARITAVSNSASQRDFIHQRARVAGLDNLIVLTRDMNTFEAPGRYDRIVSVEMFEHMRNWQVLLERVASWLQPEGFLFLHVFCHRAVPYLFEDEGADDWMARHFFTGGLMPSLALPGQVTPALAVERQWEVSGLHYERTLRAWLAKLDAHRGEAEGLFQAAYGDAGARRQVERWRLFFLACAELFGYRGGGEWIVGHTLLRRAPGSG